MIRSSSSTASSRSSIFVAVALTIAMLYFGRLIFIPLALALVFSFLLTPLVSLLERGRLGRVFSTLTVLAFCFAFVAVVGWAVTGQLLEITGHIRDYKENLQETIRSLHSPNTGAWGQATATVRELNKELAAAPGQVSSQAVSDPNAAHPSRPIPVQVTAPPSNLIQDLRAETGTATPHRKKDVTPEAKEDPVHGAKFESGSRLEKIAGGTNASINSSHHQAVEKPGKNLSITSRANDGTVEAVEWNGDSNWVVGVQWHPERMFGDAFSERLFSDFIAAARNARGAVVQKT